jgi:DNA-binding response OmpR family regulator
MTVTPILAFRLLKLRVVRIMEKTRRILIAEDDYASADTMREYLQMHGFDCDVESRGGEVAKKITPDTKIVILDINLAEGPTGLQLLADIKQANPEIKAMIITGDSIPENRLKSLRLGADYFFAKPIDLKLLLAHLKNSIDKRELA